MKKEILLGLVKKLEGERDIIQGQINLYLENANIIPGHTGWIDEIEVFVDRLAHVNEKLSVLKFVANNYKDE